MVTKIYRFFCWSFVNAFVTDQKLIEKGKSDQQQHQKADQSTNDQVMSVKQVDTIQQQLEHVQQLKDQLSNNARKSYSK